MSGGWVPVGGSVSNSFTAVFEGNGHTISGLASAGSWSAVGMFGFIGTGAEIRNLRLDGNAAIYTGSGFAHVGGLAGSVDGADVSNCHVTGEIRTSAVSSNSTLPDAGGLIGSHVSGAIIASSSSANVSPSGDSSSVLGGLVGSMDTVSITASRASGNVVGGGGMDDIGGLVGIMRNASITASWAAGDVDGEEGSDNDVGGLVGDFFSSSITASYATGDVVGGTGRSDNAGGLIGSQGARAPSPPPGPPAMFPAARASVTSPVPSGAFSDSPPAPSPRAGASARRTARSSEMEPPEAMIAPQAPRRRAS